MLYFGIDVFSKNNMIMVSRKCIAAKPATDFLNIVNIALSKVTVDPILGTKLLAALIITSCQITTIISVNF
ncbi:hypothetical protein [Limosilactobacillus mucosae]|uniref:Uncharacterized protein n=1 Tax=Limosilactobacillus mucosae TaxID=97478 RepID=A0AAJ1HRV3_LIMMU|nr:hypothetical protein [Limosilactobacillus mucosae]MDC2828332.1 hypothetical protein [Limosilactobacillus mucosae]MDC2835997.1 hypothetical protein [Limosilactobacillus mucosae]